MNQETFHRALGLSNQIILSKCDIIASILSENLIYGQWISINSLVQTVGESQASFCAVGAILKDYAPGHMTCMEFSDLARNSKAYEFTGGTPRMFSDGYNFFPSLVTFFDNTVRYSTGISEDLRYKIVEYIDKYFPDKIIVSSDGYHCFATKEGT